MTVWWCVHAEKLTGLLSPQLSPTAPPQEGAAAYLGPPVRSAYPGPGDSERTVEFLRLAGCGGGTEAVHALGPLGSG